MKTDLAIVGGLFVFMSIAGAIVSGWNFHVVFASDEDAMHWHLSRAADLQARIDRRKAFTNPPRPDAGND